MINTKFGDYALFHNICFCISTIGEDTEIGILDIKSSIKRPFCSLKCFE